MKYQLSDSQRQTIEALQAERDALEISNEEFARRHLPFDGSKWSKIRAALNPDAAESYFDQVKDVDAVFNDLDIALREVRRDREHATRFCDEKIVVTAEFKNVAQAVRECRQKRSPERLIVYLAETGGGKTYLCEYLRAELQAHVVETREAWKRSYSTALQDLCRACRIRLANETVPSRMEDRLIDGLSNRRAVLAMDEGEFFGTAALNGLKLLLNKTQVTIVIAAIPEAYARWNRYYPMEATQLARRTHAIVTASLDAKAVAPFLSGLAFEAPVESYTAIANAANKFGAYSLIRRVREILAEEGKNKIPGSVLGKAITKAELQMKRL